MKCTVGFVNCFCKLPYLALAAWYKTAGLVHLVELKENSFKISLCSSFCLQVPRMLDLILYILRHSQYLSKFNSLEFVSNKSCLPAVRPPEAVAAGVPRGVHARVAAAGRGRGRLLLAGDRAGRRGRPPTQGRSRATRHGRGQVLHPLLPPLQVGSQVRYMVH